jgi:hypothetical protein
VQSIDSMNTYRVGTLFTGQCYVYTRAFPSILAKRLVSMPVRIFMNELTYRDMNTVSLSLSRSIVSMIT